MNLTISADEDVIRRARAAARLQGRSLNDVLRETLERLAGAKSRDAVADEFLTLAATTAGVLATGYRREDAYDSGRNG